MQQTANAPVTETDEDRRDQSPENKLRRSIFDVPVALTVAIGRKKVKVSDLLDLKENSVVPLDAKIDDAIELIVEGRVVARGELIESGEAGLAVRITEIPEQGND